MVKKLFALASVTALTGLMAAVAASGCSSTTVVDGAPATEAGTDGKSAPPKTDSAPDPEPDAAKTCPQSTPITTADIEADIKWLPPAPTTNACTQKNMDDFKALFAKGAPQTGLTFPNIKTVLGTECSACVFSEKNSPTWSLFANFDGMTATENVTPSCFAHNSVGGEACGKARFTWEACLDIACPKTECADDAAIRACQKAPAQNGPCKDVTKAYAAACKDEGALIKSCGTIFDSLAVSCGGGSDGGLDAAPPPQ